MQAQLCPDYANNTCYDVKNIDTLLSFFMQQIYYLILKTVYVY